QGIVKGTAHSYVGQEAVATGACANLREDDFIVSNHRGHGHTIAKGARMDRMMAELMGRQDGYCRGLGGSMHIAALDLNILGCNGIVAAGVPIGAGAALAAKLQGTDRVALTFFGDGGANQGVVHEAMNLASVWKLPFIFLCENNKYALSTDTKRTTAGEIAKRAAGDDIPHARGDGNAALAVYQAVKGGGGRGGRGPDLRRGGQLPLGRAQHAGEPARLPDEGGGARVDRARPHRAVRAPRRRAQDAHPDAAEGARGGRGGLARRGGALRH